MIGGHQDFKKNKAGGALSARDLNALKREVVRVSAQVQRESVTGADGILARPRLQRPVKLVWGVIIERNGPSGPPTPPTGQAGAFTYKARSFDGKYTTTLQRPILVAYNDVPEVIAAPTILEDKKNCICLIAIDAPDSDGNPSVQLFSCRERLNFELCPQTGQAIQTQPFVFTGNQIQGLLNLLSGGTADVPRGTSGDDGGDVTVPGSDTQIIFNNAGALGALSYVTWTGTNLSIDGGSAGIELTTDGEISLWDSTNTFMGRFKGPSGGFSDNRLIRLPDADGNLAVPQGSDGTVQKINASGSLSASNVIDDGTYVKASSDIAITSDSTGLILIDNAGTPHYWRVTVNSSGTLVTTDLGTSLP